jgi:hypothetical protein
MTFQVKTTFTNKNPNTIWNRLAAKLGREPTNQEATEEVRRILREVKP